MSSSSELIVLTGASGSLGAVTLEHLIFQRYRVNAILRSFAKSKAYIEATYPDAVTSGQLKFTEIPDMAVPGAFDEPFSTADKVLHIATPVGTANSNFEETMIKPSLTITDNVFQAAKKSVKVKRVIITGSIVSAFRYPQQLFSGRTITSGDFNDVTREEASENLGNAYSYSKVSAEQQAWAFMGREKPAFDLVFFLAPAIPGRSIENGWRSTKLELGGRSDIYRGLFDVKKPGFLAPYFHDIDDVAGMHVKALDMAKVPGNKRYLQAGGIMDGNYIANKIREEFPELRDRVPAGDTSIKIPENLVKLDLEETNRIFGTQWKEAWESAKTTVEDILETENKFGIEPVEDNSQAS